MFSQQQKWAVAVIITGLIIWLSWDMDEKPDLSTNNGESQADYSMELFRAITMGPNGKPNYWLNSKYMTHDLASNITQLEAPFITFFQGSDASWELNAQTGQHYGNTDELFLLGDVHISRNSNQGPTLITTKDFRLLPKEKYGETKNQVIVSSPNGNVTAQGMRTYFQQHRISLLSKVKGQYVPEE